MTYFCFNKCRNINMKNVSLLILFVLTGFILNAQIPNAGFESWTSMGSYENPDHWGNMNATTAPSAIYTTIKGTPGASGNYYTKLTTKEAGGVITPGIIVSGQLNTSTWQPASGFAYTQRAETLKGKYQFMGYNNDVATIAAWLTKWNISLNKRDTIATLYKNTTGMIHVWTDFTIPFLYRSTLAPDTAVIMISSSSTSPKKNSFIWLDDLFLDGLVTSVKSDKLFEEVNIFPSPARNEVNLSFLSDKNYVTEILVLDNVGKIISQTEVEVRNGSNLIKTDLVRLHPAPGMYFLSLKTPSGIHTRKFIIAR